MPDGEARLVQQLPLTPVTIRRRHGLMAERLRFETNDPGLAAAAEAAFGRFPVPGSRDDGDPPLVVRLVSSAAMPDSPGEAPTYHSQGDLLLISGGGGVAAVNVATGVATGVVSPATASDTPRVRYAFVEAMALAMLARPRGYVTIHAAGVVRDEVGVVLAGPAGAGKSTLAVACARRGFGLFAEDAVFVHDRPAGLEVWGLPWTQRLLPDARNLFPELARLEPRRRPNGEDKLEIDLDELLPGRAVPCARGGPVILLERGTGGVRLEALGRRAAVDAIEVHWPYDGGWTEAHDRAVRRLADGGVYRLRNGGSPDDAVTAIEELLGSMAG